MKKEATKKGGVPAIPFMQLVKHFAFMYGLPFVLYKDQKVAIAFYYESLRNAGSLP